MSIDRRIVLQSASFIVASRPQLIPCAFGLSPKFSTPVEKTVENRLSELAVRRVNRGCNVYSERRAMNLWDEILARIETKVNRHSFYTWFKPTTFVAEDGAASRSGCRTRSSRTG